MPLLTFPKSANGAIIQASLWPSKGQLKLLSQAGKPVPSPVPIPMLVDTGAEETAVDEDVIRHWGLAYRGSGLVGRDVLNRALLVYDGYQRECTVAY